MENTHSVSIFYNPSIWTFKGELYRCEFIKHCPERRKYPSLGGGRAIFYLTLAIPECASNYPKTGSFVPKTIDVS